VAQASLSTVPVSPSPGLRDSLQNRLRRFIKYLLTSFAGSGRKTIIRGQKR